MELVRYSTDSLGDTPNHQTIGNTFWDISHFDLKHYKVGPHEAVAMRNVKAVDMMPSKKVEDLHNSQRLEN